MVIENRAGAGGNIGMDVVAKSPADGHTLLMSDVGSHAINVSIYKKLPFDPEADFSPVATSAPVSNIRELVAYAARNPISFGSAGNGSVNHLLGEMFSAATQSKLQYVPCKGAAPALTDLLSGQIQRVFTSLPSVAQHIRNESVKGIDGFSHIIEVKKLEHEKVNFGGIWHLAFGHDLPGSAAHGFDAALA